MSTLFKKTAVCKKNGPHTSASLVVSPASYTWTWARLNLYKVKRMIIMSLF